MPTPRSWGIFVGMRTTRLWIGVFVAQPLAAVRSWTISPIKGEETYGKHLCAAAPPRETWSRRPLISASVFGCFSFHLTRGTPGVHNTWQRWCLFAHPIGRLLALPVVLQLADRKSTRAQTCSWVKDRRVVFGVSCATCKHPHTHTQKRERERERERERGACLRSAAMCSERFRRSANQILGRKAFLI